MLSRLARDRVDRIAWIGDSRDESDELPLS